MSDIVLALGGGGIKGIAHLGVIRCLEEAGYHIRAIAGTSAGGLIGAIYAAGYTPAEIEEIIYSINRSRLFSRAPGEGPGLMGLSGLTHLLVDRLGERRFEDLSIPFACTAVELETGQEIILSQGRVMDALLATIAVPGVFPPKVIGSTTLIDGGVLDPVPVALARWLMPNLPIIAVALSPIPEEWKHLSPVTKGVIPPPSANSLASSLIEHVSRLRITQAFQIFTRSIDITSLMLAEMRLKSEKPDVIIRPDVAQYGLLDEADPQDLIALGEKAAKEALADIQHTLPWYRSIQRRMQPASPPGTVLSNDDSTAETDPDTEA